MPSLRPSSPGNTSQSLQVRGPPWETLLQEERNRRLGAAKSRLCSLCLSPEGNSPSIAERIASVPISLCPHAVPQAPRNSCRALLQLVAHLGSKPHPYHHWQGAYEKSLMPGKGHTYFYQKLEIFLF